MPIVLPEVTCFPKDLMAKLPSEVEGRSWMVANTMARQEKSLARDLVAHGIPFYLPLVPRRLAYKGRKLVSLHPVFSGFVFIFATEDERRRCLATGRVATVLNVPDQDRMYDELKSVAALVLGDASVLASELSWAKLGLGSPAIGKSSATTSWEAETICDS
jgi:hypothetical protein